MKAVFKKRGSTPTDVYYHFFQTCCQKIKDAYDGKSSYMYEGEGKLCIIQSISYDDWDDVFIPIYFCPFCGNKIEYE